MFRLIIHFATAVSLITIPSFFEKSFATSNYCPKLDVVCNSGNSCWDSPFDCVARLEGIRVTDKPIFKWTVSGGKIINGQGTSTIKVDSTGFPNVPAYAVVEVNGIEPGCNISDSASEDICDPPPITEIDRYGKISFKKEKSRLDRFANYLKEIPQAKAYLVAYNNSRNRAERAKKYLVQEHNIKANQIVILAGGKQENITMELYLVPPGAKPPEASQN